MKDDSNSNDDCGAGNSGSQDSSTLSVDCENPGSQGSTNSNGTDQNANETSKNSPVENSIVPPQVLLSMISELQKFDNEYLKQKKSKKKSRSKAARAAQAQTAAIQNHVKVAQAQAQAAASAASSCKNQRLFQRYDMVAPPNKVTPTAFLNTSANRFKHAGGTSAFQNPREDRSSLQPGLNDPFSTYPGLSHSSELLQQRSALDLVGLGSPPHPRDSLANFFHNAAVSAASSSLNQQPPIYDNVPIPALSDLLSSYKNHSPNVAAAIAQRQLEHSFLSPAAQSGSSSGLTHHQNLFGLPQSSNGAPGSSGSSSSSNNSINSNDSAKSPASDVAFPPSPSQHSFPLSHHQHHLNLNRMFPFPLIADPPSMLSSLRQSDPFRTHSQWPSNPSSPPRRAQPTVPSDPRLTDRHPSGSGSEDAYRPLLISSLSNPYFTPHSNAYSLPPSSVTSQPLPWPNPLGADTNSNYTQL